MLTDVRTKKKQERETKLRDYVIVKNDEHITYKTFLDSK